MVLDAATQVAAGATVEEAAGYWKYRKLMQQWKEEAKNELAKVKPFQLAKEVQRPTEMLFRFRALKTWSAQELCALP